jgi:hypothetical protein
MSARSEAENKVKAIISTWVTGTALTGWLPGSSFVLGVGDMVMIRQVAAAYGIEALDEDAVRAHFAGVYGSILGSMAAAEVAGLVPIFGWVAKSAMLAGKAKLIGDAVNDYFRERSPLPTD